MDIYLKSSFECYFPEHSTENKLVDLINIIIKYYKIFEFLNWDIYKNNKSYNY